MIEILTKFQYVSGYYCIATITVINDNGWKIAGEIDYTAYGFWTHKGLKDSITFAPGSSSKIMIGGLQAKTKYMFSVQAAVMDDTGTGVINKSAVAKVSAKTK